MSDQVWIFIRTPGCVPQRKGPFRRAGLPGVLREMMAAWPVAYLAVVTIGADGSPDAQDGPEFLEMLDGRSASTARAHRARCAARWGRAGRSRLARA